MKRTFLFLFSLLLAAGISAQTPNTLTPKGQKQGWVLLFNGTDLNGWTSVGKQTAPSTGWTVQDGILTVNKKGVGWVANSRCWTTITIRMPNWGATATVKRPLCMM